MKTLIHKPRSVGPSWIELTVLVRRSDLTSSLNNVAHAKHALLQGDPETALRKLDGALSWCWPMLGVNHPLMGEKAPDEPLLYLDLEGKSRPVRT